jgi:tRNA(Arg) A34 adenosine deaminase TadA
MAGKQTGEDLISELFLFAKEIMDLKQIYPYVSFIVKDQVIISRGYNRERETYDLTNQDQVVSIRQAQKALDTGKLNGYSLYSFFEPTMLGFDVALWSGIRDFHWCVNAKSYPASYNPLHYYIEDYKKAHPHEITLKTGIREQQALKIVRLAEAKHYFR